MTPLAHALAAGLADPKLKKVWSSPEDRKAAQWLLDDTHFFECTEIADPAWLGSMAPILRDVTTPDGYTAPYRFLPAEKTWLEMRRPEGGRFCLLCFGDEGDSRIVVYRLTPDEGGLRTTPLAQLDLVKGTSEIVPSPGDEDEVKWGKENNPEPYLEMAWDAVRLCVLINLPHILERKQHLVHKGLAKKLGSAAGRFPLHGWTELKLEVHLHPKRESGPHEAGYTGGKCLHFCRAHVRLRDGKLQAVRSHWRGDAALGIKRTRYTMLPGKHSNGHA